MNSPRLFLAAFALALAATAGAQTLRMEPQVVGVTTYEASNVVNLVVVKPEIRLTGVDPSVLTVNTNGTERNIMSVYPCDSRGDFDPDGAYLALGLEKAAGRGIGPSIRNGVWREEYNLKVCLKKGKVLRMRDRQGPKGFPLRGRLFQQGFLHGPVPGQGRQRDAHLCRLRTLVAQGRRQAEPADHLAPRSRRGRH